MSLLHLWSCAVGPDYVPHAVSAPDAWSASIAAELGTDAGRLGDWWSVFGDPRLDALIERAAAGSRDLRAAVARIDAARAALGVARGSYAPDVDGAGSYERYRVSANGPAAPPPPPPIPGAEAATVENQNLTRVGLDASWEIDVFGRIRRSVQAAAAELDAAVEDQRDVQVALFAEVARAFVEARTFAARLRIAVTNGEIQRQTLQLTRERMESEIAPPLDVAQAETNLATTLAEIPAFRAQRDAALYRLALLIGELPAAAAALAGGGASEPGAAEIPRSAGLLGVGVPPDLLRRRPDVRAAERRLAAQVARIGVAEADLYPRFSLSGAYGYEALDGSHTLDSSSRHWSFGPSFRWNLFDGGRVRGTIAFEEARADEAVALYENVVLRAFSEAETALAARQNEAERLARLSEAEAAAARAVEYVKARYQEGLVDFQNVLDAERTRFQVEDRAAESRGRLALSEIDVYRALGGGWSEPESAGTP